MGGSLSRINGWCVWLCACGLAGASGEEICAAQFSSGGLCWALLQMSSRFRAEEEFVAPIWHAYLIIEASNTRDSANSYDDKVLFGQ